MAEEAALGSIERLERQHEGLEHELGQFRRRLYLTSAEQMHARVLKKKKLITKDRIVALRRMNEHHAP